jgi:hypothetical protein
MPTKSEDGVISPKYDPVKLPTVSIEKSTYRRHYRMVFARGLLSTIFALLRIKRPDDRLLCDICIKNPPEALVDYFGAQEDVIEITTPIEYINF